MSRRTAVQPTSARIILGLLGLAGAGVLLYLLSPVLAPFFFAMIVAYVFNPVVRLLMRAHIPRGLAVTTVFAALLLIAAAVVITLVPMMQREAADLAIKIPAYVDRFQQTVLPWLRDRFGSELPVDVETLKRTLVNHWLDVSNFARAAVLGIAKSGAGLGAWLLNLFIVPVVTFYMLLDWDRIPPRILGVVPSRWRKHAQVLGHDTDQVLGSFLRGQLSVMAVLACIYSVGLWLAGVELAFLIGGLAGLVSFVPYLGLIVGVGFASIVAYVQFQDPVMLLIVLGVFGFGQLVADLWLTPRLIGTQIGLHPLAVIFAVMAGGQLFGFTGVLLALPAAAALKVWLAYAVDPAGAAGSGRRRSA